MSRTLTNQVNSPSIPYKTTDREWCFQIPAGQKAQLIGTNRRHIKRYKESNRVPVSVEQGDIITKVRVYGSETSFENVYKVCMHFLSRIARNYKLSQSIPVHPMSPFEHLLFMEDNCVIITALNNQGYRMYSFDASCLQNAESIWNSDQRFRQVGPLTAHSLAISVESIPQSGAQAQAAIELENTLACFYEDQVTDNNFLGKGVYGDVCNGSFPKFGYAAFKVFHKTSIPYTVSEIDNLKDLNHQNIIRIYGVLWKSEKERVLKGFVMEKMTTSLGSVIDSRSIQYDDLQIYSWMEQAASGLMYLHETKNMAHRDLKPENMLLDSSHRNLKLCDFGMAKNMGLGSLSYCVGSGFYRAPEVIINQPYTTSADIYSLGISLWNVKVRKQPYDSWSIDGMHKIAEYRPRREEVNNQEMLRIIENCWSANPSLRPSAKDLHRTFITLQSSSPAAVSDHSSSPTLNPSIQSTNQLVRQVGNGIRNLSICTTQLNQLNSQPKPSKTTDREWCFQIPSNLIRRLFGKKNKYTESYKQSDRVSVSVEQGDIITKVRVHGSDTSFENVYKVCMDFLLRIALDYPHSKLIPVHPMLPFEQLLFMEDNGVIINVLDSQHYEVYYFDESHFPSVESTWNSDQRFRQSSP